MKKENRLVLAAGVAVGLAALALTALGNPGNMGFCIACFERDIAGAVGLHSAAKVQYVRPEIIGLVLGAFAMSLIGREFRPRTGSSPATRFVLGAFVMIGALVFLGCPLRMVLRLGGGDLNAVVGLLGFVLGICIGIVFLRRGFDLKRSYPARTLEGTTLPAVMTGLLLLVLLGMGGSVLLAGLLFGPGTGAEALPAVLPYLTGADGGILRAVGTVLVVLVSLLLAYLTLSVVAGIAGACCSNMEDVGSANGAVLLIVMGGYLVSCVVGVVPSHGLAVFASLCPILSLFCAPVQWAAGNVPLAVLLASWALQLIVIAALMRLCARVYRELIVHRGSRVKLKQLLKMAKGGAQA